MDKCTFCLAPITDTTKEQGYCSAECRELGTGFVKEERSHTIYNSNIGEI